MDRNTIIAIVLCVIVITVGMTIQTVFFAPEMSMDMTSTGTEEVLSEENKPLAPESKAREFKSTGIDGPSESFEVNSNTLNIVFNPKGGTISSIKLPQHSDNNEPVELIYKEDGDIDAFMLYYGNDYSEAIDDVFDYKMSEKNVGSSSITQVTFTKAFSTESGDKFTIEKSYAIPNNDEYMIQLAVTIKAEDGKVIPLNLNGNMYSLSFGPQIGPEFASLARNYDYRRVIYKTVGKDKQRSAGFRNGLFTFDKEPVDWVGLTGKYFSFLLIPENDGMITSIAATQQTKEEKITQKNTIYVNRTATGENQVTDIYSFYAGPKTSKVLKIYDRANDNIFGLSDHKLEKALDVSWLSWLETILKVILEAFYFVIPNYGVAIILLTIFVKILLIPLSKKGTESTAKMSALTPKIEEIKTKYADDPEAQNQAIAKLYQEEKINPMGSCLPMLIQFPIFIALYGLLNKNFELRGAMFIPGWITDLSIPDTVATLPFRLPFLGNDIHILPIIYTVSMIYSMKITQTTNTAQSQKGMMWFMTYGMPIMFFFMMYNAPSGLLVYWTVTNALSIGQQIYTNHKKKGQFELEIQEKDKKKKDKKAKKRGNK